MTKMEELLHVIREQSPYSPEKVTATDADVRATEAKLGVKLPVSYRTLVTNSGPDDAGSRLLYWIGPNLPPSNDIAKLNTGRFALWPKFLIAVIGEVGGDEFCFDTRYPDASGEYPIVHWNHEINDENTTEFRQIADSLVDFLLMALKGRA